ncbi:MAG TPA: glycoside hydrolase family 3 protein [Bryobacteraceae bacterium]|nr:glycoside hydrolase family 3 protein [Bryobacteraceae bacterium]
MAITLEQAAGQQFLLSFQGKQRPPRELIQILRRQHVGGIVLFRAKNMGSLDDLRGLTEALQAEAAKAGQPPLLIAADQEGGQLMAIGDATPFPGNLALGATRSEKLAYLVGQALGREVSAVGINVDFAPVCDVNNNPRNPVVGTRSFGENPALVGRLSAAMVKGLQRSGVAASAKHFPGHGDTSSDSHHGAPVLPHDLKRLQRIELPPFRSAIAAGVRLIMTAHIVLPALNGHSESPATLSPQILRGLLRRKLGFEGLIVTDALDMHAMDQGAGLPIDVITALNAGADLLIFNHDLGRLETVFTSVLQALRRGLLSVDELNASALRILNLKKWVIRRKQLPLSVVGCREHRELAQEVARQSVTLVHDRSGLLPVRVPAAARIAVVVPRPEDLTPADTSSYLIPGLAPAVRRHHPSVEEFVIAMNPSAAEVRQLREQLRSFDLVIAGTINADTHRGQAGLITALLKQSTPTIAVALRMPYDIWAYPLAPVYACTYSILQPSMDALADALWGLIPFPGQLPVSIPEGVRTH